jgi:hypothetical protein
MKKVPTLTTDQVREAFSNVDDDEATEENRHNFDVWLVNERHRVADLAIAKERKRILDIIAHASHRYDSDTPCPCGAPTPDQYDYIEELINSSINETIGEK